VVVHDPDDLDVRDGIEVRHEPEASESQASGAEITHSQTRRSETSRTETSRQASSLDAVGDVGHTADPVIDLRATPIALRQTPDDARETPDSITLDLETPSLTIVDDDPLLRPYLTAHLLSSPTELLSARRLHAEVYVASGFISGSDVAADGTIKASMDPWPDVSTYFGVVHDGVVMATVRQIAADDPTRLPALGLPGLTAEEVDAILALPPGSVVEISGLARRHGATGSSVVAVYVRMWQESLRLRHRAWVMAVDLRVFEQLRRLICGNAVRRIGPLQEYLGSTVVPAVIWCDELNPEQRRLARVAGPDNRFRSLVPRLFPHPAGELR
jgi:hypothetical protein